jgi:hypothetical protein
MYQRNTLVRNLLKLELVIFLHGHLIFTLTFNDSAKNVVSAMQNVTSFGITIHANIKIINPLI